MLRHVFSCLVSPALLFCSASFAGLEPAWTFQPTGEQFDASVGIADLNNDGRQEVVAPTIQGAVIALDADGGELWRWRQADVISAPPTIAELMPAPGPEVVVLSNTGHIYCLNGRTGEALWDYAMSGGIQWGSAAVPAVDLDGDGKLDLVTGDARGQVVALHGDGSLLWSVKYERGIKSAPAVGDMDGDGKPEILFGAVKTPLVCLDNTGTERWRVGAEAEAVGAPVLADMDGDGKLEAVTGIRDGVCVVGADGQTRWCGQTKGEIDSGISVADLDGDGSPEIVVADLKGQLTVFNAKGDTLWTADIEARTRRAPSVADLNGDGSPEIVVAGYSGKIHVFSARGELKDRVDLGGASNATANLADLKGDGALTVVCPVVTGTLAAFRWPGAVSGAVLWPLYRFDCRNTAAAAALKASDKPRISSLDTGRAYVGRNEFSVAVDNPKREKLAVALEVRQGDQRARKEAVSAEPVIRTTVPYVMGGRASADFLFECVVTQDGKEIARQARTLQTTPFAMELAESGAAAARMDALAPQMPAALAEDLRREALYWRTALPPLREQAAAAALLAPAAMADLERQLTHARTRTGRILAAAELFAKGRSVLLACAANPWASFGGMDELAEGRTAPAEMTAKAFAGEIESTALNLFNLGPDALTVRIDTAPLTGPDNARAPADAVILREAVATRTQMGDLSADALPKLNQGRNVVIPGYDGRQVYFEIDTRGMKPGEWTTTVRLRGLDVDATETTALLKLVVWPAALPEKRSLGLCHWGYVESSVLKDQPEAALEDQVRHGTSVFTASKAPKAKFDGQGNLVGDLDYTEHDAYCDQYAGHGIILFQGFDSSLTGPAAAFTPEWNRAAVAYLRKWVEHLKARGMDYKDWAIYTIDEPGLKEGLVDIHINLGKAIREADSRILIYTDPVGDASLDDLKAMAPYTDIWCPARIGIVNKPDQGKLDFIKSTGKDVYTYECQGNAKHRSPLGYYRGQAWLAWMHGLKSLGFWTYCTSAFDPWFNSGEPDYLMIYQGDGVVPSRRWHAVRDGIEDHAMLTLLRGRMDKAAAEGRANKAVEEARQLLDADAHEIARFCGLDEDDEVPGVGGLPQQRRVEDRRWQKISVTREHLAALLEALR
jgi:outer membrane protein assembly factor BamB